MSEPWALYQTADVDLGGQGPVVTFHHLRRGSDRYLCGKLRAPQYRGLPAQGGPAGPRRECPTCEVIYLNIMFSR